MCKFAESGSKACFYHYVIIAIIFTSSSRNKRLSNIDKNFWKHWDVPIDQGKASLQYQDESLSKKVAMSCLKVSITSLLRRYHYVMIIT